ncbi:MAG: hypothetical protein IJT54_00740 [Candidatus Methanomethylophilaceae archaeon]|nr:hypothetical protein [Candidatus Methanomethylophilaceae archaeon]
MKITRLHRALFLIVMMIAVAIYFWLIWSEDGKLFSAQELISLATMIIGALCCVYSMRYGLKRVLSISMIVLGLYVIVKIGLMTLDGSQSLSSLIIAVALGGVSILLGLTIWLGYDYNVIRIRMCMLVVAVVCIALAIVEARLVMDFDAWWEDAHLFIALCLISSAVVFVTMDPSMEMPTMASGAKDNIIAMRRRMVCTDDAYMLTTEAKDLKKHIDSNGKESMEILVRSNDYLSFNLIVTNKDKGEHLLEIRDLKKIFMSTLLTMKFNQAVFADDHVSFYGDDGKAMKILIYDHILENMNQPLIFGRELNIQKKD